MTFHQKINRYLTSFFLILSIVFISYGIIISYQFSQTKKALTNHCHKKIDIIFQHFQKRIDDLYKNLIEEKENQIKNIKTYASEKLKEFIIFLTTKIDELLTKEDKEKILKLIEDKITNFGSFNAKKWLSSCFKKNEHQSKK
ncbi:hypothetical protein C6B37_01750 [Candidatus Phytoplasma phoenicium]|uniref:Uncharacterized protein n=1 Tax=Candidatus Phytoplasma phoenicium TaxID=198422 RepID=A0A2S8NU22_9MOLU|nr:hypothetical protein C6B37_01750 [Candidatus Phytoplasma phoenicium]